MASPHIFVETREFHEPVRCSMMACGKSVKMI